jgi:hypothetical protein
MFDMHWTVGIIPIIAVGVVVFMVIARKHKDKPSTDHIFKL